MTASMETCSQSEDKIIIKKFSRRIRCLEICLSFAIAGMLLQAYTNWIRVYSMSERVQVMEDNVFQSIQKQDDKISFFIGDGKTALKKLKQKQNEFVNRLEKFEKSESITYKKHKHFPTNLDKFREPKSINKSESNKNTIRKLSNESKTQINQNSSKLDNNLFQLNLSLDSYPGDTRWELIDSVDGSLIASESYEEAERYSLQYSTFFVSDGTYKFSIFDLYGDGICNGVKVCSPYNISINNELIIKGTDFGSEQSHNIGIHNNEVFWCFQKHLIEIQIKMNENIFSEKSWELIDTQSNEVLANQNENAKYICVNDGIYLFSSLSSESKNITKNEHMMIFVNGTVLVDGPLLKSLQFSVVNIAVQTLHCHDKPILNPISDLTGNIYDERISQLLEIFESLSSHDAVHNYETAQYTAACYILYDDVNNMKVEDKLTLERYILYLFFISTEWLTWGEALPSNFCDVDGVWCDQDGHIITLHFGK